MTAEELIGALSLPPTVRLDQRVSKKLLIENAAATAADKRQISEAVDGMQWVAALKPSTIAVPVYRDAIREYLEIHVLRLSLREGAKEKRLVELVHRAVPYPVVLVTDIGNAGSLSVAQKRWSAGEAGATVLDGEVVSASVDEIGEDAIASAFCANLALGTLPRSSMYATYSGWMDVVLALRIARVNGTFSLPDTQQHAEQRRRALAECARLDGEIAAIRAAAPKESQMARQVEMNLNLQRLRAEYAEARSRL